MRSTIRAVILAAGLVGLGAAAQAAPVPASTSFGVEASAPIVNVQMMRHERRRMMRHRMMRHRMMRHRMHRM